MKALFLGKHKRSAVGALEHLAAAASVEAVVAPPPAGSEHPSQRLDLAAERLGLRLAADDELYASVEPGSVDLVLSFLFWKRIRRPLIDAASIACLNFHPAPLPEIRGLGGFNVAILEDFAEWGVSAHFVDEQFDTGDIVRVDRFPIDRSAETALSLDITSQEHLFELFRWTIDELVAGRELPRTSQGEGRYIDRGEFEAMRRVCAGDSPELTARRIRAFWYPPYDGATMEVEGRELTLVNRGLLEQVAATNLAAGLVP